MTRPQRTDVLIVAALTIAVVVEQGVVHDRPVSTALNVLGCLALLWRRALPVASAMTAIALLGGPEFVERNSAEAFTPMIGMIVALFSLVAYAAPRRPVPASLAAVVLLSVVSVQTSVDQDTLGGAIAGGILFAVVVMALPAITIGVGVRRHAELRRRLEEQAHELEAERERHAAAAAGEERARVAGELHDLVAAGVQSMLADVAHARRAVTERPDEAATAILVVEERGREALTEMRRLLGVLRRGDEDLALAPHPSLDRLVSLAQHRSVEGRRVSVQVDGAPQPLPAGLDVAAYRVVEEALDRAPATGTADVLLRWAPREVLLEVAVDGPELADAETLGPIRERVALFSGRLEAERRPRGGSALRARLPLESVS
jgi:signal transduction histidine kinase